MHTPRKRFGQHFLHDKQIIKRLVDAINPQSNEHLVEIGPGLGALTLPVLNRIEALDVIELDRDIIPLLKEYAGGAGHLTIHTADALGFDFASLCKDKRALRLIGNLPYNISTPLIFHLLSFAPLIQDMHFMLQKEVVDRITAQPDTEHYGRLSVMVQYHCAPLALFDVPPTAFNPPPKVDSSIIRLIPFQTLPFPADNPQHFALLVKQAFSQRRKTLRNALKNTVSDAIWQKAGIDSQLRAETLSVENYVKLSNLIQDDNSIKED